LIIISQQNNGGIMQITKNNKTYAVAELKKNWKLTLDGVISIDYTVPKFVCPTFAELEQYVASNDIF